MAKVLEVVRKQDTWFHHHYCGNSICSDSSYGVERGSYVRIRVCITNPSSTRLVALWSGSYRNRFDHQRRDDYVQFVEEKICKSVQGVILK